VIKPRYKILSAAVFAAACMGCDRYVYSTNVPGQPPSISCDHYWGFRAASGLYGLEQYSYWTDSKGAILQGYDFQKQPKGTHKTFTCIYLGNHCLTLPVNIWMTAALCAATLILGLWLLVAAANGMMRKQPAEPRK
jgi:hypothetical protein